jgi:hypothetical protein
MPSLDAQFQKTMTASKGKSLVDLGDEVLKIRNRLFHLYKDWEGGKYGTATVAGDTQRMLDSIAETAAEFGAKSFSKDQKWVAKKVRNVRKALGYTVP